MVFLNIHNVSLKQNLCIQKLTLLIQQLIDGFIYAELMSENRFYKDVLRLRVSDDIPEFFKARVQLRCNWKEIIATSRKFYKMFSQGHFILKIYWLREASEDVQFH